MAADVIVHHICRFLAHVLVLEQHYKAYLNPSLYSQVL